MKKICLYSFIFLLLLICICKCNNFAKEYNNNYNDNDNLELNKKNRHYHVKYILKENNNVPTNGLVNVVTIAISIPKKENIELDYISGKYVIYSIVNNKRKILQPYQWLKILINANKTDISYYKPKKAKIFSESCWLDVATYQERISSYDIVTNFANNNINIKTIFQAVKNPLPYKIKTVYAQFDLSLTIVTEDGEHSCIPAAFT